MKEGGKEVQEQGDISKTMADSCCLAESSTVL